MARAFGSYPKCRRFKSTYRYHNGPVVKRLRHRPFTAVTRVRFPSGSPDKKRRRRGAFFIIRRSPKTTRQTENRQRARQGRPQPCLVFHFGQKARNCGGCAAQAGRRGRAAGPAAEQPTRAEPVCFGEAETACGPDPYLAEDGRGGPGKAETDPRKGRTPK